MTILHLLIHRTSPF